MYNHRYLVITAWLHEVLLTTLVEQQTVTNPFVTNCALLVWHQQIVHCSLRLAPRCCMNHLTSATTQIYTILHHRIYCTVISVSALYHNISYISPLKSVWRVYGSTSSWPRHDSARGFSFSLWLVIRFWVRQSIDFDCVQFDQTEFLQYTTMVGLWVRSPDTGPLSVVIQTSVSSGIAGRSLHDVSNRSCLSVLLSDSCPALWRFSDKTIVVWTSCLSERLRFEAFFPCSIPLD